MCLGLLYEDVRLARGVDVGFVGLWVCAFGGGRGEEAGRAQEGGETWDMGHGNMGKAFLSKSGGLGERW